MRERNTEREHGQRKNVKTRPKSENFDAQKMENKVQCNRVFRTPATLFETNIIIALIKNLSSCRFPDWNVPSKK